MPDYSIRFGRFLNTDRPYSEMTWAVVPRSEWWGISPSYNSYDYLVAHLADGDTVTMGELLGVEEVWQVKFNPDTIQQNVITVEECE